MSQADTNSLLSFLKSLEKGDRIEVSPYDKTFEVVKLSPPVCYEVKLEGPDGDTFHLRDMPLSDSDVLQIERQSINSEPVIVRGIEVVD